MVQKPLRRHRAGREELSEREVFAFARIASASMRFPEKKIKPKHPSDNGGFTWVICRLTIREDVMRDILGLSTCTMGSRHVLVTRDAL